MTLALLTAFEPYDCWKENSSWQALVELTRWYDGPTKITTRRYPVDLTRMSECLRKDLQQEYDFAIHVGQSPGSPLIKLEAVGLNVRTDGSPLSTEAPEAYRSSLPLARCAGELIQAGIPSEVSHHAGTYLCNAALFLSQHYASSFGLKTQSMFIHLPLSPSQAARENRPLASMSVQMTSTAVAMILDQLQQTNRRKDPLVNELL